MRPLGISAMFALLVAGCSVGGSPATTEALLATTTPPPASTTTSAATTSMISAAGLVEGGCAVDGSELAALTPLSQPLALIEESSGPTSLTCNFVGVDRGLDAGIRFIVVRLADFPDGHFVTPGEFESPVQIAGRDGVATGRGQLRLQLDESRGLTLDVTIRAIRSDARLPGDGDYLAIRNAVATYLIEKIG